MHKLAIVTTHPIQYHVPWLVLLQQKNIQVKVFYTWEQSRDGLVYDPGFGKAIKWDIPLLEGYDHVFVRNSSPRPGTVHFFGMVNPGLIGEIESWKPDCLMVIGWNFYSHLACLRHFHKKIPVFFRGDSVLLHEKKGLRLIVRRLFLRWVYRHVDFALYVGTHNRCYYLKHGIKPSQLVFSPQSIDIERFSRSDRDYNGIAKAWREELKIPADHLTVLFAGKMTEVKNPSFMLDLAVACKKLPISFIMVGNGHLKEGLEQRAKGMGNIFFLDFQNQSAMPAVYRMGDVFIMPSISETWGMAVNEAMACGRPVMVSEKVGSAADLVLENKTGIIFGMGDVEKCVRFLRGHCEDRTQLEEMGVNSSALIQFFSFSHIVDSIQQTLSRAMPSAKQYKIPMRAGL